MLEKIYCLFRRLICAPQEQGEYSAGIWQAKVRGITVDLCRQDKGRLLEVGCGEGLFLSALSAVNKGLEIYGIDNRQAILEKARLRLEKQEGGRVSLFTADASRLPFDSDYFDTVVCINVIYNLESVYTLKKVLQELARVTKEDGKLIIDFRNSANLLLYFKYKFAPYYDSSAAGLPLKTYRLKQICSFLEEVGFKIIRQKNIGFFYGGLAPVIILEARKER